MVRRSVGGATPPSVMALLKQLSIIKRNTRVKTDTLFKLEMRKICSCNSFLKNICVNADSLSKLKLE